MSSRSQCLALDDSFVISSSVNGVSDRHVLSSQVFSNSRALGILQRLLQTPAAVIALNCKAGFHRTSAFLALLSCVLFAPLLDLGHFQCLTIGSIQSGTSVIDTAN